MGSDLPPHSEVGRHGRRRSSRNPGFPEAPTDTPDPAGLAPPRGRRRAEAPPDVADPAEYWGRANLRRHCSREFSDEVLRRSAALPAPDAALLRAVFVDHAALGELAALTRSNIRALRRRLSLLVHRVMSDEFAFVVQRAHTWPDQRRRVAHAVVLAGMSYRRAGDSLGLSLHTVRQHCASISAMCENAKQLAAELAAHGLADRGRRDA